MINVPSKKKRHLATNFDSIWVVVVEDNGILELQGLLEHNNFIGKRTIRIKQMLCIKQA
jgi:hypothetical protein